MAYNNSFIDIYTNILYSCRRLDLGYNLDMIFNITKEEFSKRIENYVKVHDTSYMDTVIHFFDEYSYDFSVAPKLLTQPILEKIEQEAKDLNFLPRTKNKLPFH
jgi:hypothetical protein